MQFPWGINASFHSFCHVNEVVSLSMNSQYKRRQKRWKRCEFSRLRYRFLLLRCGRMEMWENWVNVQGWDLLLPISYVKLGENVAFYSPTVGRWTSDTWYVIPCEIWNCTTRLQMWRKLYYATVHSIQCHSNFSSVSVDGCFIEKSLMRRSTKWSWLIDGSGEYININTINCW